jgi:hypothetical protein
MQTIWDVFRESEENEPVLQRRALCLNTMTIHLKHYLCRCSCCLSCLDKGCHIGVLPWCDQE